MLGVLGFLGVLGDLDWFLVFGRYRQASDGGVDPGEFFRHGGRGYESGITGW